MRPGLSDYVTTSMINRGSGSFAKGEGQLLFQSRKFKKWVIGLYYLWRNKWGFRPQAPPLDPPLMSLIEVANVDSAVLMGIVWWILQINVSFTIFHNIKEKKIWFMLSKSDNKYLLLAPSSNKHKIIVYLLPK